jgi:glycosyltransferase involved in cell wall biosynthesis
VKRKVLSVGHPEFPIGFAQVQRQLLLARAILLEGWEVTVLCRYGIHPREDPLPATGVVEGIEYIYCSGTTYRPDGFLRRNGLKIRGLLNEIRLIRKFNRTGQLSGMLISTNGFCDVLFYYFLGKILRLTTVLDIVEYWTAYKDFSGLDRLGKSLYDRYFYLLADRVICISDFLVRLVRDDKKHKVIKIPAITDFDKFSPEKMPARMVSEKYFLFCGSSEAYFEIIDFVISAFEQVNADEARLVLVTRRNRQMDARLGQSKKRDAVLIRSDIPYHDLVNLYLNSEALIIPMRNTDQDRARFPHKISEYCASGRPIITNRVGEIGNYFDPANAYLCDAYSVPAFAEAMQAVLYDPGRADQIGRNSYQTGLKHFNYKSYSKSLTGLFNSG